MKITHVVLTFIVVFGYVCFVNSRDEQLLKVYDACLNHHSSCPESWKTKPAFSHR